MAALGLSDDPNLLDAGRIGALFRAVNAGLRGVGLHAPVEVVVVVRATATTAVPAAWSTRSPGTNATTSKATTPAGIAAPNSFKKLQ